MGEILTKLSRAAFVTGTLAAAAAAPIPTRASSLFTRYSMYQIMTQCSLTPILTAYENGVSAMLALNPNDPRSWIYQANMHGTTAAQNKTAWNSCQHASYFFFSWHRMYLYYFERIVRKMSGYSKFTLPFWDYTNGLIPGDSENVLPAPFRDTTSSLYTANRNAGVNAGNGLPASAIADAASLAVIPFSSGGLGGFGFGGAPPTPDVPTQSSFYTGDAEQQPHNVVHDAIGGLMGSITTAAQDPIFYLHHANIDRMWDQWWNSSPLTLDPGDKAWSNTQFTFFDENAQPIVMTSRQVATVQQLGYQYGSAAPVASSTPLCPSIVAKKVQLRVTNSLDSVLSRETSPPMPMMGPMASHGVKLTAPRVTISIAPSLKAETLQALQTTVAATTGVILRIDGISYDESPGYYYEMYLNLPAGLTPNYLDEYYVGNLSFFGAFAHRNGKMVTRPEIFNITRIVQRQIQSGTWKAQSSILTMVMQGAYDPTRALTAARANTRIDSVVITDR